MKSISPQTRKLYASNLLTGLVFWYGIEKLFMQSIGISAVGIGAATALLTIFLVIFDIPGGMLADKWSRKGTLFLSTVALALASLIAGSSHNLAMYLLAEFFYGLYIVTTSGVYQAIIFDSLREERLEDQYSRINGRIYASFLIGASIGNIMSGFLAHAMGYRAAFYFTIIPCIFNALVILSMHEPRFHDDIHKERLIHQARKASLAIFKNPLTYSLAIIFILFTIVELFKLEFGQLYMLRYTSSPQSIGILWALFALAMSLGSIIAHHFRTRLHTLIILSSMPLVLMSVIDNKVSLLLFMLQAVAAAALLNQIETRIQENTPSHVRASVMSVVMTLGRLVSVPFSLMLGWLFRSYTQLTALRSITVIAVIALVYWLVVSYHKPKADEAIIVKAP